MASLKPPHSMIGLYKHGVAPREFFGDIARIMLQNERGPWVWHAGGESLTFREVEEGCAWALSQNGDQGLDLNGWVPWMSTSRDIPSPSEQRTVHLFAGGDMFTTGGDPKAAHRQTARLQKLLHQLCARTRPTYAAITVDWPLETPDELRRDPNSMAFRDFYLDRSAFPIDSIRREIQAKKVEEREEGFYIFGNSAPGLGRFVSRLAMHDRKP
ncbi:hypothetical protein EON81_02870 [bacterium]|nr:MAG: hypothetical protein EON81_02870 [bacterium]